MDRYYRFANVEIAIHGPDQWMYTQERYLAAFRVEQVLDPYHFTFRIVPELTRPTGAPLAVMDGFVVYQQGDCEVRYIGSTFGAWSNAHMRTSRMGKQHIVELRSDKYEKGITPKTVLNAVHAEHLIAQEGGFILHASAIRVDDQIVVFTAPSGTGKSTQANLWRAYRGAQIINGDRCAVRCTPDGIWVDGIPFMGSSAYCENVTLPLAAVVYLAQAPQTSIRRLKGVQAFSRIWEGVSVNSWNRTDMVGVMDSVKQVIGNVPVYYLECTPDESAVTALEQQLRK